MSDNAASPREVREYLLENAAALPEGVTVGARGRISKPAREFFTARTGREIVEPTTVTAVSAE